MRLDSETNMDEEQHSKVFFSLKLLQQHAEPQLEEFLSLDLQLELEMKHRDEEDALYRRFIEKRQSEEVVLGKEEGEEREKELKKLTSNERGFLADLIHRQSLEMLQLIHTEKLKYLEEGGEDMKDIAARIYPKNAPSPTPPEFRKNELYHDDAIFSEVDRNAEEAAKREYDSFAALVKDLVGKCTSEVEKARAIFRWITAKDINSLSWFFFYPDQSNTRGAPQGLLRGIEFGTESYPHLFKRLCSYAGLHSVVIKGYSKSAGYLPGMKFKDNSFRNAWNAVYVGGGWRLIQCNWGARRLVHSNDPKDPQSPAKAIRKSFDEHYFLTDPDQFIYEFRPLQDEWQLLKTPLSMSRFEDVPLVRSLFFRYGLAVPHDVGAVLETDETGEAAIEIIETSTEERKLTLQYTFNMEDGKTHFKNTSLKRFVLVTIDDGRINIRIHAPTSGVYIFHLLANSSEDRKEPMKFESIAKFKIICETVTSRMVPLPDCAGGEWGPSKAERLFGITPLSHPDPVINCMYDLGLEFKLSDEHQDLSLVTKVLKNGTKSDKLKRCSRSEVSDGEALIFVKFLEAGQYGIDIFARENCEDSDDQILSHCCKYLVNVSGNKS